MIKAVVKQSNWSGHGEGGTLVHVEITGWHSDNVYNSTVEDKRKARAVADFVNRALRTTEEELV